MVPPILPPLRNLLAAREGDGEVVKAALLGGHLGAGGWRTEKEEEEEMEASYVICWGESYLKVLKLGNVF